MKETPEGRNTQPRPYAPRRIDQPGDGRSIYLSAFGLLALKKAEQIVREEMNAPGRRIGHARHVAPALWSRPAGWGLGTCWCRRLFPPKPQGAHRVWPTHEEIIPISYRGTFPAIGRCPLPYTRSPRSSATKSGPFRRIAHERIFDEGRLQFRSNR